MDENHHISKAPLGIRILNKIPFFKSLTLRQRTRGHQANVLLLTFLAYAAYHAARKPTSVVKNVLHRKDCENLTPPPGLNITEENDDSWCSWEPFVTDDNGDEMLGWLDSIFLFSYAFGMYFTGQLAERIDLRHFLALGMMLSGLFSFLFGVAYWADIHSYSYFVCIQILAGLAQSTGWPGCVAAVGNWFGKSKRGLIMGVWWSHHSVGNMVGSLIASSFVEHNWGLSFAVPSIIMMGLALTIFFFLVSKPASVGCLEPDSEDVTEVPEPFYGTMVGGASQDSQLNLVEVERVSMKASTTTLQSKTAPEEESSNKAISFFEALLIPGVIEFALALFFSKLINYTFHYWLPRYIKESGLNLGDKGSADLSTLFDVGGIFGGILAGLINDLTGKSAITCAGAIILAFPMLMVYQIFGAYTTIGANMVMLFIIGLLLNIPYALITTSVSADLGTRLPSSHALATVSAILDGTGSIGAAVGPLMAGYVSSFGWEDVFYVLMAANAMSLLFLMRLVVREVRATALLCKHKTESHALTKGPVVVIGIKSEQKDHPI